MCSRKTNVAVLTDLMQFSRYGGLAQVFIINAIQKQARLTAAADPQKVDSPLIAGQAWVGVAAEIRDALDQHYGSVAPEPVSPRKAMLYAALLAASDVFVNECEVDKIRMAPPGSSDLSYVTTFAGDFISMNDQQIELVDEETGSRSSFLDVEGARNELLLQQVLRLPVQITDG